MGEPICLMRSFSSPASASRGSSEGDPLRALTESISFGRFMSESLSWEKFSIFTRNRYLEEVEQVLKPGYVAQKKAYFDAHYKKRAAMKAATIVEQDNASVNDFPLPETSANGLSELDAMEKTGNDTFISSVSGEAMNDASTDQPQDKDVLKLGNSTDSNTSYPAAEKVTSQIVMMDNVEEAKQQIVEVENPSQGKVSSQLNIANNHGKVVTTAEQKIIDTVLAKTEKSVLQNNKRQMSLSLKLPGQDKATKLRKSSTKHPSSAPVTCEKRANANRKKSLGDSINRRRLISNPVCMSDNLASQAQETTRISARTLKENSSTPKNSTRSSIPGISKLHPSINRLSENKRTQPLLNKSVSRGAIPGKILQDQRSP